METLLKMAGLKPKGSCAALKGLCEGQAKLLRTLPAPASLS